jgi:hypothetical protein
MSKDERSSPDKIQLMLTQDAKHSGIVEIYIEQNKVVVATIKLQELNPIILRVDIGSSGWFLMLHKLINITKTMLSTKNIDKGRINEIVFHMGNTLNDEQNYALFRTIADYEAKRKTEHTGKDALVLLDLASCPENTELFFKDQYGEPYGAIRVGQDKHLEIIPLRGNKYEGYLTKLFYENHGKLVSRDSISRAINLLAANTFFDDKIIPLHVRVAWGKPENNAKPDCIYIDMTDQYGRIIEVF